ncbi:MAG: hypothetical protein A2168_09295 [Planctomycetes bacterium RBG_13_50_24]|nr:MAG: hypothetical protein A2168_09295 [Planctomycetes bacterium RBG_13_50_24]
MIKANKTCAKAGCPFMLNRRSFLAGAGALAAAANTGLFEFASSLFAAEPGTPGKPVVGVVFVRPDVKGYWMGWPGAAYDIGERQRHYTEVLNSAAEKFKVQLDIRPEPLADESAVNTCLSQLKSQPPNGLVVISMSLNQSWPHINKIASERGNIPTIVFSPMGTSFTSHLQGTRDIPGVYVAATQDIEWLNFGVRMLRTIWDMEHTRMCVVQGDKAQDQKLDVIGTTLHYVPRRRYPEEFRKVEDSDEVRALADFYTKQAKKIVEPTQRDIMNSVKNYVVAKRIMAAENCQGISLDCLPLVESRLIPAPPCMAWLRLNDEGSVGACEAEWNSANSLRLTSLLFDRPGFMQDPAPNTVNNTLMGAHCSCPTKLDGFDKPPAPLILRSHSESNTGVAPQVLWREGQKVTVMKFQGPESIILGTGRMLRNIETPPAGGCRTSVELELDDVADSRDTKGFHQLFIYGDLEIPFKAYCRLAGIKVVHI